MVDSSDMVLLYLLGMLVELRRPRVLQAEQVVGIDGSWNSVSNYTTDVGT